MKIRVLHRRKLALLLIAVCAVMLASSHDARADRIAIPPIHLAIGDQYELGQVHPAIPEGDADIAQYVNFMIGLSLGGSGHVVMGPHDILVTRSMSNFGTLPSPAILALRGTGTTTHLGAQGTYSYLFAHYGGPGGGFAEVWFIPNLSGVINIPATGSGHGLSGWALFTAEAQGVPDGGATVMLLGTAVGALGLVRRYLVKR
jgi:VPDSG-CTERM motif